MATQIAGKSLRNMVLGTRLFAAAATLPATTTTTIWTVSTGRILLTSIVGQVTTAIQAQADTLKLVTISSAALGSITTDLTAGINVTGAALGNLYGITGVKTDAAVLGSNVVALPTPVIIQPGTISWNTSATNTGAMSWTMTYIPLDDGAAVA